MLNKPIPRKISGDSGGENEAVNTALIWWICKTGNRATPSTAPLFLAVKGRSFICSLTNISLWLQAKVVITVSCGHKKENSPLPAAVERCLVACLIATFDCDPCSHGTADLFWLPAAELPCASKDWSAGLTGGRKRKQVRILMWIRSECLVRIQRTGFHTYRWLTAGPKLPARVFL